MRNEMTMGPAAGYEQCPSCKEFYYGADGYETTTGDFVCPSCAEDSAEFWQEDEP